ncbi:MAG: hypothetical protein PF503_11140 [Desulfobacula sp.]|jgi:hypothetical protein|nr:hypothetical protein [Desulfobacula sp.]
MDWKFWGKNHNDSEAKLYKPQELPSTLGKYLVVALGQDPDWTWSLKAVIKEKKDKKGIFEVRVFDPESEKQEEVKVLTYTSLDFHKELILFNGWYDKNSWDLEITDHRKYDE